MVSLYIVRHGQTEFNLDRKIQGWCDSPLTELGINQAKSVGLGLKDIDFVGCACSDKQRTRDTAKYILEGRDIEIIESSKIRELNFGSLEEKPVPCLFELSDEILMKGLRDFGGEDISDLIERYLEGLKEIAEYFKEGNVLVVCHGRAITTVLKAIDDLIDDEIVILAKSKIVDNCSVSRLDYIDGKWDIVDYNNTSYAKKVG